MNNSNNQLDSLKSKIIKKDDNKTSISGLSNIDYRNVNDKFKLFFDKIMENTVNFKIFCYIYNLYNNQLLLLNYENIVDDYKRNNSYNNENFEEYNCSNNNSCDFENISGMMSRLQSSSSNDNNISYNIFKNGKLKDLDNVKIKSSIKNNKEKDIKIIKNILNILNESDYNDYTEHKESKSKKYMFSHLLDIVKKMLNDLFDYDNINKLYRKFNSNSNSNSNYNIVIENIFNKSGNIFQFQNSNIQNDNYYTTQFLTESKIGFMTNFIYDVELVETYYKKTIESLIDAFNSFVEGDKDLLQKIIILNINYLVLGSFSIKKNHESSYEKLILIYYYYVIIEPFLDKLNLDQINKIKKFNDLEELDFNENDNESKNNIKEFIIKVHNHNIQKYINKIFIHKYIEIKKKLEKEEEEKKRLRKQAEENAIKEAEEARLRQEEADKKAAEDAIAKEKRQKKIQDTAQRVVDKAQGVAQGVAQGAQQAATKLGQAAQKAKDSELGQATQQAATSLAQGAKKGAQDLAQGAKKGAQYLAQGVKKGAKKLGEGAKDSLKSLRKGKGKGEEKGQNGGYNFFDIKENKEIQRVFMQGLIMRLNNDIYSKDFIKNKYEDYENLHKFIVDYNGEENKDSYFFLLRNFYKSYVLGEIFNNIMIYKNCLHILDNYQNKIEENFENISINLVLDFKLNFNFGNKIKYISKKIDIQKFALNYYGTQKTPDYRLIDYNDILELFELIERKVETNNVTKTTSGKITERKITRMNGLLLSNGYKSENITPQEIRKGEKNQKEEEFMDIKEEIKEYKKVIQFIKTKIIKDSESINIELYDKNQKINENLKKILIDKENLFDFGFMIENDSECEIINNIVDNLYENVIKLNNYIELINNNDISNLKDFLTIILDIISLYIKIELYLLYIYIYWNKDEKGCKKIFN